MKNEAAVSVDRLTKRFGGFTAVDDVSFQVSAGEVFGFLGANGAGKTTVIRILCGLLTPDAGTAEVGGFDVASDPRSVKRSIGYMSQKFSLYEEISVRANIEFYGGVYGLSTREIKAKTEKLLDELRLHAMAESRTGDLPLGWKQRLALGTALLHDPRIVFLDEPTGGVDPISRRNFWRIIYQLASEGVTVFVTTHYMDEAEYCSRLAVMHQGRIIETGNPSDLKRKHGLSTIQEVFIRLLAPATARRPA